MRCTKDSLLSTESGRLLNAIFHRTFVPFREARGVPRGGTRRERARGVLGLGPRMG